MSDIAEPELTDKKLFINDTSVTADQLAAVLWLTHNARTFRHPLQLKERFGWGKNKCYDCIKSLIELGVIERVMVTAGNGFHGYRYVVTVLGKPTAGSQPGNRESTETCSPETRESGDDDRVSKTGNAVGTARFPENEDHIPETGKPLPSPPPKEYISNPPPQPSDLFSESPGAREPTVEKVVSIKDGEPVLFDSTDHQAVALEHFEQFKRWYPKGPRTHAWRQCRDRFVANCRNQGEGPAMVRAAQNYRTEIDATGSVRYVMNPHKFIDQRAFEDYAADDWQLPNVEETHGRPKDRLERLDDDIDDFAARVLRRRGEE